MSNPHLKAVIVESGTIKGEYTLRVIKDGRERPMQMVLKDEGFVPGDIVRIGLLEEFTDLVQTCDEHHVALEEARWEIEDLKADLANASYRLNDLDD